MSQKSRPVRPARPAGASSKGGKRKGKAPPPAPSKATRDTPASVRRTPVKVQSRPKLGLAGVIIGIAAAVVIAGVVAIIASSQGGDSGSGSAGSDLPPITSNAAALSPEQLEASFNQPGVIYDEKFDVGADHRPLGSVTYTVDPPAGGGHFEQPADPGWYVGNDTPPDMTAVHSLEHGYVIIWVKPDLPAAEMDQIHRVFNAYKLDVLVLPRANLTVPVAATAWHRRLLLDRVDAQALANFVGGYRNQGPERIPHNIQPRFT